MKFSVNFVSPLTLSFFGLACLLLPSTASISRGSNFPDTNDAPKPSLEPINGTHNFRMHGSGKKSKDDKWIWDGREGRYIYCVRAAESKCQELEYTKFCFGQNIPYMSTSLDLTNYYSQDLSLEKLISFQALKHVPKCWSVIQPFLCAVFFPKCEKINGIDMVYLPSLEMCKITLEPCKILYNSGYFPDFLKCNETNFPSKCNNDVREMKFNVTGQCLSPLVPVENPSHSYKEIEGCGLKCKNPLYKDDEHRQLSKYIFLFASSSLVLHVFTLSTFIIDWHNGNKYPALAIFYVNLCYFISTIGWLAQFVPGGRQDIVCREDDTLKQGEPSGGENLSCIMQFILIFYFSMAAICWFVIFTYAWLMSFETDGKMQERCYKKSSYFHLIAWSIPLVLTISILAISEVNGNSIVGICYVSDTGLVLGIFVLGPHVCELVIGGHFFIRCMIKLIKLEMSSKQIISVRESKKIRHLLVRVGICWSIRFAAVCFIMSCYLYDFNNSESWASSLKNYIICKITSSYSDEDSSLCNLSSRPSISVLIAQIFALFASQWVMTFFVFTQSTAQNWGRFLRRKFGKKVEEPLKLQKHKVIAQAFAKRKEFKDQGRFSISFHNSHTDPAGLKLGIHSAGGSHDFSSTWANNLPRFVNRRCALTGCQSSSSYGYRRNSMDSEISYSVRHVSVESRRNSNESQVSMKIAVGEMKTKVASRSRGSKSKPRSSRHHRRDFISRRYTRKESSTSMESNIQSMTQHGASATTAEISMLMPFNATCRRTGIAEIDQFIMPRFTTSEDEKSVDMIMKEIMEHRIIEKKPKTEYMVNDQYDDVDTNFIETITRKSNTGELSDSSFTENVTVAGRNSKNSNRSIKSKNSNNPKARKARTKSARSITKSVTLLCNGPGRVKMEKERKAKDRFRISPTESLQLKAIELVPLENIADLGASGRSDVGIQTENQSEPFSSNEYVDRMMRDDNYEENDDPLEINKSLLKRISLSSAPKRHDPNEMTLTESEKLKQLLLP